MMKSTFSRVLALSLLVSASVSSWAQPNDAVQVMPRWESSESSADALTLIGSFYNKMNRAKSFRGSLTTNRTTIKEGKVTTEKTIETQQSWIDDGEQEGDFSKLADKSIYTTIENNTTTTEKREGISDGVKIYNFDEARNVWSQWDQTTNGKSSILFVTRLSLVHALALFGAGSEFRTERKIVDGQEQFVVTNSPVAGISSMQYIFNPNTGDLQSWKRIDGATTIEYRWREPEFDVVLPDSLFKWKVPEGAKEVERKTMRIAIQL